MKKSVRRLATLSASAGLLIGGLGLVENSNAFEINYVQAATYKIKLTKNSYVYTSKGKKTAKKLKKGKTYKCYGKKKIHGKWFYKLGKSRFIRVVNAKKVVTPAKNIFSSIQSSISSSLNSSISSSSSSNREIPNDNTSISSSESSNDILDTMAKQFSPELIDFSVVKNGKADPKDAVNLNGLPNKTTVKWEEEPDTGSYGHKKYNLIITYPDNSKDVESVNVNITTLSGIYSPEFYIEHNTVELGEDINPKNLIAFYKTSKDYSGIKEGIEAPEYTASWIEKPDTSNLGKNPFSVEITYSDGSKDIVRGEVTVVKSNQASNNPVNSNCSSVTSSSSVSE